MGKELPLGYPYADFCPVPFTEFAVTFDIPATDVGKLATGAGLKRKEWNELVWSFEALAAWSAWLFDKYGRLKTIRHRSNPDDPPDLDLVFEGKAVGVEHTLLQPHPLGFAEAISERVNPQGGRIIPSISQKWTRDDLIGLALNIVGVRPNFANVGDEHFQALQTLAESVERKCKGSSEIIVVTDRASFGSHDTEWLATAVWRIVNSDAFEAFGSRTLIFHLPTNPIQFFSALIRRDEPLRAVRDGKPTNAREFGRF